MQKEQEPDGSRVTDVLSAANVALGAAVATGQIPLPESWQPWAVIAQLILGALLPRLRARRKPAGP